MTTRTILIALALFAIGHVAAQNINTTYQSKVSFPGQTLANIWGYVDEGKEYALVGASKGLVIVDISNPTAPQQIVQIPGPDNLWKEIKTYSHYAYVTSEGGQGIQVVDLSGLPSPTLQSHFYKGDGVILNQLNKIHALHIDETKGFLYAWGGNLFSGGAKIFDLKADPYNPTYIGKYDQLGYIHDGYVDNDTMYSCHIYAGQFAIVNMANKATPELINTQTTPNAFTHNTWLTPDRKTILATDEKTGSFLSSWDVTDPTDIKFLDKIQSNPGSNSIVHNTYAMGNWAISSWYKDGFTMVDVSRPDNLVQVGNYDTYTSGAGDGFEGCWGVYPFFPSGNLIASNIGAPGELYVITPNYVRAAYLEGTVTNGITGALLANAQMQVVGSSPLLQEITANNGEFKTGQAAEGYYKVRVTKSGFQAFETYVYFQRGEVVTLQVPLFPNGLLDVSGSILSHTNGQAVPDATIWLYGNQSAYSTTTDASGIFNFQNIPPGIYDVAASATGLGMGILSGQTIVTDTSLVLELFPTHRREKMRERQDSAPEIEGLSVQQNPFSAETTLYYQTPVPGAQLTLVDSQGKRWHQVVLPNTTGQITIGAELPSGIYYALLSLNGKVIQKHTLLKNERK